MKRLSYHILCVILPLVLLLAATGCKKDQLQWQQVQKLDSHSNADELHKVLFTDSKNGYVFGGNLYHNSVVLYTADGGTTWKRTESQAVGELLISATIAPSGRVYSCGYEGKLIYNTDSPNVWNFHQMEDYWFRDIAFTDSNHAWVVGGISFNSGMMWQVDAYGNRIHRDSFPYQYNKIKMLDGGNGFICGYGVVKKTTDGGNTWTMLNVGNENFTGITVLGLDVWLCGYWGSIFHSPDLGEHWQTLRNGNDLSQQKYRLNDILFTDKLHGWAVGEDGKIVYSRDGGVHWSEYAQFTTSVLFSVSQNPDGDLFVAGANAALYRLIP